MGISHHIRQYWPLTVITVAIAASVPFITSHGDRRPGMTGFAATGTSRFSTNQQADLSFPTNVQQRSQAGFTRSPASLPFYGFDNVMLETPMFKSWWNGKTAPTKLREINANTIVLGSIWKDAQSVQNAIARLREKGIKVIVQVTDTQDWVNVREDSLEKSQPIPNTFAVERASHVFAQARNQGVGHFADFILLGGDSMAYATQAQRQKMYQVAKQYFPDTPVIRRFGLELEKAEILQNRPHPMGGTWDEYRFGPDECDLALVSVGRGIEENRTGVRVSAVLEQLNSIVAIIKSRHNEAAIIVRAQLGDEHLLQSTKAVMWSSKEIDQFVSAILTSTEIDGLLFSGMGSNTFDFGNPEFAAQRAAFREAAPVTPPVALSATASRTPAGK